MDLTEISLDGSLKPSLDDSPFVHYSGDIRSGVLGDIGGVNKPLVAEPFFKSALETAWAIRIFMKGQDNFVTIVSNMIPI